jgi:cytochrome-b5 reductase
MSLNPSSGFVGDSITRGKKKVPLPPGFSQLDWMRAMNKVTQSPGRREFKMDEVRLHNSIDDAWTVLNGRVYDMTAYLPFHPGSIEEIMRGAGRDATLLFNEYHPWVNFHGMLEKYYVGTVRSTPAPPLASSPFALTRDGWFFLL